MAGGGMQTAAWGRMNPYQQASGAQNAALGATRQAMQGNAGATAATYDPALQARPGAISGGIGGYMNPYENDVVQQTSNDLMRQNEQMQVQNAANASAAGAFGGSRHGLVEAQTNEATQRALANTSAGLRNQGWMQAAGLSGQDVANRMNVAGANQQAQNAGGQWNAGAQNAFQQNQFGNALQGAGALAGLGQGSFGYGSAVNGGLGQMGQTGQGMAGSLIGQGAGMFDRYTGQPLDILNNRTGALGANPLTQTGTQTGGYKPGMMDYLGLAAGVGGSALGAK